MDIMQWVVTFLLLAGACFVLLGSVALLKLPDFYTRLHGPTKATTLGLGSIVLASVVFFNVGQQELSLNQLLIALFLFISAPITAHMFIKVARHQRQHAFKGTHNQNLIKEHHSVLVKTSPDEPDHSR